MSSDDIRITDLANPQFSELEKQAMASARPVVMTPEAILEAARAATGLSDFGRDDFRERLAVWMQTFDEDKGLNALGRMSVFDQTLRYAIGRLRIEDLLKRHPEILQIKIDRPILIAGLPRSGTTHLVNVIGTNPDLRSMPLWESMEPVPKDDERSFESTMDNPRYRRCVEMWHILTAVLKYWSAMHEMAPDHIHEEVELQCYDFASYMPDWIAHVPRWRDYYYAHDQTPHYQYARKIVQALTWFKGPNRWVMKSPPNMENLPAVFATYPDATVIMTHRDPVAVIQSIVTMMGYWDRIRRNDANPAGLKRLTDYWIGRIERLLRNCVRDRELVPQAQVVDVMFHEYMADQRGIIDRAYKAADMPISAEANRRIDAYLNDNPRGKHGRVIYDLAGDFGVDVPALRRRFQFYYDRFPVKREPTLGE